MYDLIGDIHGHADELTELLRRLGYDNRRGCFSHYNRTAIFVGDFIDRGPKIREVLQIVRRMVDAGTAQAVMGNHEFNAIAYHSEIPGSSGQHFRKHSEKNNCQHKATMEQLGSGELAEAVEWFKTLPVVLDLDGLRVVHACWDREDIDTIESSLDTLGRYSPAFLLEATTKPPATEAARTSLYHAVERVLKGPEVTLPDGLFFLDKEGNKRFDVRVKWYESPDGKTFRDYILESAGEYPNEPIPPGSIASKPYPIAAPPVFIGHYWLRADKPAQ